MYNPSSIFQLPTTLAPSIPLKGSVCKGSAGNFYGNGRFVWVTDSKRVEVFNSESGQYVSGWSHPGASISCIAEMRISRQRSLLLLGLVSQGRNILAVFDPDISVVIRALTIPAPIVVIHAVSPTNLEVPGLFSSTFLKRFSGVVAVGCRAGHAYIVDLGLRGGSSMVESVAYPHAIYVVGWQEASAGTRPSSAVHGSLELTAGCHHGDTFVYQKDGAVITFSAADVAVTALHFVPHICSLLVGYSFGCFQVFNLSSLSLSFSSSYKLASLDVKPPPVTHFAYQEPENDPRPFVYLWVARGPCAFTGSISYTVSITLCRLIYNSKVKTSMPQGYCYETLQEVAPLLEHPLSSLPSMPSRTTNGNYLLQCSTVERRHNSHGRDEPHDESVSGTQASSSDLTLASFVWSSYDGTTTHYYLGLFDINQWYHAQVPPSVRWRQSGKHSGVLGCSYFAFFMLDPALGGLPLQGGLISNATYFSFLPPVPETHMWPTSLSFDFGCLVGSSSIVKCQFMGLQRTALYELKRLGAAAFSEPQRLFSLCEAAELLSTAVEHVHEQRDLAFQRKALLTVCHENDLMSTLLHCAQTWKLEDVSESECVGLPLLLQWVEQTISDTLEENARLCSYVFEESLGPVESSFMCRGQHLLVNLRQLSTLVQGIVDILKAGGQEQLYAEVMALYHSCVINSQFLDIVLWFTSNGLLPYTSEPDIGMRGRGGGGGFHYPAYALQRQYSVMRKSCPRLAIDYLTEELRDDQDQSLMSYPPASLKDLINIFSGLNSLTQHCVIIYFLYDMKNIGDKFQLLVTCYVRTFALCKHLAAFVEALWQIDHDLPENSLSVMMSQRLPKEWFPWQHGVILENLLNSGHNCLAMKYIQHYDTVMTGLEGAKLKIAVHISQGSVIGAFKVLCSAQDRQEDLVTFLLEQCHSTKQLHSFLELPLGDYESLVCSYLENHTSIEVKELLVMHYLKYFKYIDALQLHEKLKTLVKADPDPRSRDRAACREDILLGYSRVLPQALQSTGTQAVLSNPPQVQRVKTDQMLEPLTKLTAKETKGRPPLSTKAGLLLAVMEKVAEGRMEPSQPFTPFKRSPVHVPFLSTPASMKCVKEQLNVTAHTPAATPKPKEVILPTSFSNTKTANTIAQFIMHLQDFRKTLPTPQHVSRDISQLKSSMMTPKPPFCLSPGIVTRNTPHSILKMKQHSAPEIDESAPAPASPDDTKVESFAAATKDQMASNSRKIRFAVEGKLLKSPSPDKLLPVRSNVQFPPIPFPSSSPYSHMTQSTPPLCDASDEFVTPTESPSNLETPLKSLAQEQVPVPIPLVWDVHVADSDLPPAVNSVSKGDLLGHGPSSGGINDEMDEEQSDEILDGDSLEMAEEVEVGVEQEQEGEGQQQVEMEQEGQVCVETKQEDVKQAREEVAMEQEWVEQVQEEVEVQEEAVQENQAGREEKVSPDEVVGSQPQEKVSPDEGVRSQPQEEVSPDEGVGSQPQEKVSPDEGVGSQPQEVSPDEGVGSQPQARRESVHQKSSAEVGRWEQLQKPVVLQPLTKSKQLLQSDEQNIVNGEAMVKEPFSSPYLLRKAQRGHYSLPTLKRTAPLIIHAPPSVQSVAPSMPVSSARPQTHAVPSSVEVLVSSSGSQVQTTPSSTATVTTNTSLLVQTVQHTPSSRGRDKPSLFAPIMESDIRSIKKSQRKKGVRLRIKRLSELKPKRAKQDNTIAEQEETTAPEQSDTPDVAQQQDSYTFSHPAAIVTSSKPIGGAQESNAAFSPAVKGFVFSPPMTRSRLRRLQAGTGTESRDSSFMSQTSTATSTATTTNQQAREFAAFTSQVQTSSKEQLLFLSPPSQASTPTGSSRKSKAKPLATTRRSGGRLVTKK